MASVNLFFTGWARLSVVAERQNILNKSKAKILGTETKQYEFVKQLRIPNNPNKPVS